MTAAIAFIGFGEAGQAVRTGWTLAPDQRVTAYDVKSDDPATCDTMATRYAEANVTGGPLADTLAEADRIFCVVTADRALEAARAAAPHLAPGALWFDCNSCAPDTKRAAAEVIEATGARYVDVAVMAPVAAKKHRVPLLLAGPHAEAAQEALTALDMAPKIAGDAIGHASSIKMIRSVMVKGIEALTAECFLAARRAGVGDEVLASLDASNPEMEWATRAPYNFERMMVHGTRRAAEMREVTKTIASLGLGGGMSQAAADWQDRVADTAATPGEDGIWAEADRILRGLDKG